MNTSSSPRPWDPLPDESAKAFAAFCLYRDLPPQARSIDEAFRRSDDVKGSSKRRREAKTANRNWQGWSSSFSWVKRASAWDLHQQRVTAVAREGVLRMEATELARRRRQIKELELAGATVLLKRFIEELHEGRGTYPGMGANLEAASRVARLALDMPTVVQVQGNVQDFRELMFESAGSLAAALPEGAAQPMPADVMRTPVQLGVTGSALTGSGAPKQERPLRPTG